MSFPSYKSISTLFGLFAILFAGCSSSDEPSNLEPAIRNISVTDISRTSATLSAEIELRGSGTLDYLRFVVTAPDGMVLKTDDIKNPSGKVSSVISGLTPGSSYSVKGEGGRNKAVISSTSLTFSTFPNDPPSVSSPAIVSSGPTALILKFEITSDGGEKVTETGCYISRAGESSREKVSATLPSDSKTTVYLTISSLSTFTDYVLSPYAVNCVGETVGESLSFSTSESVVLTAPGNLREVLSGTSLPDGKLTVSGYMDGDDFKFLRPLLSSGISAADLSDVVICDGGESYDGSRYTKAGTLTTGLFSGCISLKDLRLPNSITTIERDAFAGCLNLESIDIPPHVSSILPSSECGKLAAIKVSEANQYFKDFDGVLFNYALTDLVWFPEGKTGLLTLPPSMTEIKESAFANSKFSQISLPESITEIGRYAFAGSAIKEIVFPDKIRFVREGIFQNCRELKSVTFGEATESVGDYILDNTDIVHLYVLSPFPPYVSDHTFGSNPGIFKHCTLHVPAASRALYRNHKVWGLFENIYEQ